MKKQWPWAEGGRTTVSYSEGPIVCSFAWRPSHRLYCIVVFHISSRNILWFFNLRTRHDVFHLRYIFYVFQSQDSAVGKLDIRGVGVRVPAGARDFLFSTVSRPVLGPSQLPIQRAEKDLSPGVKRQRHEADHSPPTSADVKNTWIYTSIPPHVFVA
jgi:hypothetical protein